MNRMNPLRRFPSTFAALALLVSPLGCGSETHETQVVELPAAPSAVYADGSAVQYVAPATLDKDAAKVDQEVRRTAGDVKEAVDDAKDDAKKAAEGAEHKAEKEAKAIEEDARKAAEKALDDLLPSPK